MHIFHKWTQWSEPKNQSLVFTVYGEVMDTRTGVIQDRTCKQCGKYEWREV